MRRIFLLLFIVLITLVSCSKKAERQSGFVKFSVEGKRYRIENMQFMIRANPLIGEGDKIKIIPEGEESPFEFSICPTEAEAKRQIKITARNLRKVVKWREGEELPEEEDYTSFSTAWLVNTAKPEEDLKSGITLPDQSGRVNNFYILITIPDGQITSPEGVMQNCWIQIDEVNEDRVKGRFEGKFKSTLLGRKLKEKFEQGLTNEIEKEIEITNGVFDVPYKKCFKYR